MTTNDEIIAKLPLEDQEKIRKMVNKDIAKWGGIRKNSGRKTITGKVLKFTKKLTEEEAKFIDYARSNNLNYDELMQG